MSEMEVVRSAYRCKECDAPFRASTPFNVPVEVYCSFIMTLRCPKCGGKELTLGASLKEREDIDLRIEGSIDQRATNWLENGDIGTSSLTIFHHFKGSSAKQQTVPQDLSDLRRCAFLLEHVPEWKVRIREMATVHGWERLAHGWPNLIEQFRAEAPDLSSPAPLTSTLLQALTNDEDRNNP